MKIQFSHLPLVRLKFLSTQAWKTHEHSKRREEAEDGVLGPFGITPHTTFNGYVLPCLLLKGLEFVSPFQGLL